jgi:multidrug efflux pump subunit AcrB
VRSELPRDAEPPIVEVQRADRPYATFYLSFTSSERSVSAITDYLSRTVQPQLATIEGVQRVTNKEGGRQIAMRVWIDPDRLAALGLAPATCTRRCSATTTSRRSARPRATWSRSTCSRTRTCARRASSRT